MKKNMKTCAQNKRFSLTEPIICVSDVVTESILLTQLMFCFTSSGVINITLSAQALT